MNRLAKVALTAACSTLAGCIVTEKNDGGDASLAPTIVKDIVHEKYAVEKETITVSESVKYIRIIPPWTIIWGGTATHIAAGAPLGEVAFYGLTPQQRALNGAFANACDQSGCDALVGARYRYMQEDYWFYGKITCEASGYPARLTGVELIENKSIPAK